MMILLLLRLACFDSIDVKVKLEEESDCVKKTWPRRGRLQRTNGKASPISPRKRREDEDVCFVCFDGGSLDLCDRRGCTKVYHPVCISVLKLSSYKDQNETVVQVDFDDQGSWEYLFKIYWVSLKEKLSLSLDDLTKARNPWKIF
uniref:Histone-lysine N-methyltransferase NSD-like PHD zinc finger domain-containing protein n=1 Tax=Brassica campestris TaxID=3711 RepID=M4FFP2_BRACM